MPGNIEFRGQPRSGLPPEHAELVQALREAIRGSRFSSLDGLEKAMYAAPDSGRRRGRRMSNLANGSEFPSRDQIDRLADVLPQASVRIRSLYSAALNEREGTTKPNGAGSAPAAAAASVGRRSRRQRFFATVGAMMLVAVAVLFVVSRSLLPQPATGDATGQPTASVGPTSPDGCTPAGQSGAVVAAATPLAPAGYAVTAGQAAYILTRGKTMQLEIGGELHGTVPANYRLDFLIWGDPATKDSFGQAGDGHYYLSKFQFSGRCYYHEPYRLAYSGAQGTTFREYIYLVPADQVGEFESAKYNGAYTARQLDALHAVAIGYVTIPTA